MSTEFDGRLALVTGAGRGIGEAVVSALVERGARVVATDIAPDGIEALARTYGPRVVARPLDVTDADAVEAAVEEAEQALGPLEFAVNVAGVLRNADVLDTTDAHWAGTFAVNVDGVFHVSRSAARRMAARGRGSIVTVASNAAGIPRAGMAAYAASKAASSMFTKCLGLEMAAHGVRCNSVCPGSTMTDMQRGMWADLDPEDVTAAEDRVVAGDLATYRTGIPLGRIADPADIADAVTFLLSDRARHITMQDLYVDGGATLRA
ncbi:2,3-dihydro-2,3-dihydroxybenzoate dehydrogenase [Streptomyces sp. NBC_00102]|uniref:2,3-dihydro-2,3-dihydroxybenzoate dehydrogenase n=1 Tax=Streptomyces sp. NBC_00102 TaxID=2975652 RepID=UPI0022589921|nr:2,3-dihydro-2,3-dihydroxybenzoate dehydrogenase [Streptomyces sp. NBC_00102]MCX5400835.1 2,3-dihydro-2,3-dihydroxybenzoate dehydrogenase [Streptomyces sp. NBC_00102]